MRDVIERGDKPRELWKRILANDIDSQSLINDIYLEEYTGMILIVYLL